MGDAPSYKAAGSETCAAQIGFPGTTVSSGVSVVPYNERTHALVSGNQCATTTIVCSRAPMPWVGLLDRGGQSRLGKLGGVQWWTSSPLDAPRLVFGPFKAFFQYWPFSYFGAIGAGNFPPHLPTPSIVLLSPQQLEKYIPEPIAVWNLFSNYKPRSAELL